MEKNDNPVLCGGTYFTLLLEAKRQRTSQRNRCEGEQDGLSQPEILAGLGRVVYPEFIPPKNKQTFRTNVNAYKTCADDGGNLSFLFPDQVVAFNKRIKNEYTKTLMTMCEFTEQFLEVGTSIKKEDKLVKALVELIESDKSIDDNQEFFICSDGQCISKAAFCGMSNFSLQPLLLGVWHFIVVNKNNNKSGKATFDEWCPPRGRAERKYGGKMGDGITREINVEVLTVAQDIGVTSGKSDALSNPAVDTEIATEITPDIPKMFAMPDVYKYLKNAENKYSTIKTLLYKDQPMSFYSLYICNRIRFRGLDAEQKSIGLQRLLNSRFLSDATVEKIRGVSNFAIITGTGGLGKSMMMRHLMLDALLNFDNQRRFPVFVPLKDFDESAESLLDYVHSKVCVLDRELNMALFKEMLTHGSCLLLLDGLDEISANAVKRFERELESFTDEYSENMYVLSSRPFQSFVSYERFSLMKLEPFTQRQAMQLIDKLEFRPDEPAIKKKFQSALDKTLFKTHRSFTENPLLLTFMLLTFEQYAEVPSKMHIFYREAFDVLAKRHDASKGSYTRALRTGLSADTFADYFAELCFRSYNDEKFEITAAEFASYYNILIVREALNDKTTKPNDFIEDLCSNLCLMYYEGNSYHFTHRSFQEYFCALFFSKQKDKYIERLGKFFENHQSRMLGDRTFFMLYDMITEKAEEYILLPYLADIFGRCDKEDGYWTFLQDIYPQITYSSEDVFRFSRKVQKPYSFLLRAVLEISGCNDDGITEWGINSLGELPYYEEFEIERIPRYKQIVTYGNDEEDIVEVEDDSDYVCEFKIADILKQPNVYWELLEALDDNNFVYKKQYVFAQKYMKKIAKKQKSENESLLDLL